MQGQLRRREVVANDALQSERLGILPHFVEEVPAGRRRLEVQYIGLSILCPRCHLHTHMALRQDWAKGVTSVQR